MKSIKYTEQDFSPESIKIKSDDAPFPKECIYYVIGLLFEPTKESLSRKEIEDGANKKYIGEMKTAVIADNEKVVINGLINSNYHQELDLLHILTYEDIKSLLSAEKVNKSHSQNFLKSLFSQKIETLFILLKEDNPKERKYIHLICDTEKENEDFILEMMNKGYVTYFMDSLKKVKSYLSEMNDAILGGKYYPDFYFINPAGNYIYEREEKQKIEDIIKAGGKNPFEEILNDPEMKKEFEEMDRQQKEIDSEESFDEYPEKTFDRLTGFKYVN